jgi:hypothetical protein
MISTDRVLTRIEIIDYRLALLLEGYPRLSGASKIMEGV